MVKIKIIVWMIRVSDKRGSDMRGSTVYTNCKKKKKKEVVGGEIQKM